METIDNNEIINAWIKDVCSEDKTYFWAHKLVNKFCRTDPEHAWELILGILNADNSAKVIELLAAGPLEDLLAYHGKEVIEKVKKEAQENEKFNFLLGGVWQNCMDDEIWEIVQKIRKEEW